MFKQDYFNTPMKVITDMIQFYLSQFSTTEGFDQACR